MSLTHKEIEAKFDEQHGVTRQNFKAWIERVEVRQKPPRWKFWVKPKTMVWYYLATEHSTLGPFESEEEVRQAAMQAYILIGEKP